MLPIIPLVALAAGAAASAGGNAIARSAARKAALRKARALQKLSQTYNPYFDQIQKAQYELGPTALDQFQTDPQAEAAQRAAIDQMQQIYAQGGLDAQDKAALAEIGMQQNEQEQQNRAAIMQQAAMRGGVNQGSTLASLLGASQNAANQARMEGMRVGSIGRQRRLDSLSRAYDMSAGLRGQDSAEQMAVMQARDAINQFNANARRQKIADTIALQTGKNSLQAGAVGARAEADEYRGAMAGGLVADIGKAVGQGVSKYGDYSDMQDQAAKEAARAKTAAAERAAQVSARQTAARQRQEENEMMKDITLQGAIRGYY